MKCDLCGKQEDRYAMTSLLCIYKTEDVQDVCRECSEDLNKHLWKLKQWHHRFVQKLLKKYIRARAKLRRTKEALKT